MSAHKIVWGLVWINSCFFGNIFRHTMFIFFIIKIKQQNEYLKNHETNLTAYFCLIVNHSELSFEKSFKCCSRNQLELWITFDSCFKKVLKLFPFKLINSAAKSKQTDS